MRQTDLTIAALVAVSILMLAGPATAQPTTTLVGVWELVTERGALSFVFSPDGSGFLNQLPLRWSLAGGVLHVTMQGTTTAYNASVTGNTLQLSGGDLRQAVSLQRASAARAPDARDASGSSPGGQPGASRSVVINQVRLGDDEVRRLEQQFRVRVQDGIYWYDRVSGAWGVQGGPTIGFIPSRLDLGGALRPDASGGGTGVFVNGRELHPLDVGALQQIMTVQRGRFWVDERGNGGYEGNSTILFNLVLLANAARARSGGAYHHRSGLTGIGSGGDGRTSYVMGKDWSVIIGE